MPTPPPPKHSQFKPGHSGNPTGRPKRVIQAEKLRGYKYADFMDLLNKCSIMTREEMTDFLKRPDATMFELTYGGLLAQAAKGDKVARQELSERLFGKVKETIQVEAKPYIIERLNGTQILLGSEHSDTLEVTTHGSTE